MEATRFSETSVYNYPSRRHVPEDGIPRSHRCENLESYVYDYNDALAQPKSLPNKNEGLLTETETD
jgi:hypothetical protein